MLDAGYWVLGTMPSQMLRQAGWVLDAGCWLPVTSCQLPDLFASRFQPEVLSFEVALIVHC
jgi:hypothetical protein